MVPELTLWRRAAIIFLAVGVALLAVGLTCEPPPSQAFLDFNVQRLRAFRSEHEPRDPQTLRLVLLGNSRFKNATIDPAIFDAAAEQKVEAFRLVANWAIFSNFEPLLDEVQALQPDAYVIQMDLLVEEMARPFKAQIAFSYLRWLSSGTGPWSWYEPESEQLVLACTDEQVPDQRTARAQEKLIVDLESPSARRALDFIRTITADGARVILVSVPKTQAFERVLPSASADMLASANALAAALPGVSVSVFTDALPDKQFCDVTHLNRDGASAYSRWLMEQVAAAVK
jgi:hypothetical protein